MILPIWYDIEKKDILEYSLYLSDLKALSADMGIENLALEIVKRVRPDILDSHMRIHAARKIDRKSGMNAKVSLASLDDSSIRHKTLPEFLVISCRLISEVFLDILDMDYTEMVYSFAQDWDYYSEFLVWSAMANAYTAFIRETHCDYENIPKKKEAFSLLLDYSLSGEWELDDSTYSLLTKQEQVWLLKCYIDNYKHISKMIDIAT